MERVEVPGRTLEDFATDRLRVGNAPGLMQQEGAIARFGKIIVFSLLPLEARILEGAHSLGVAHMGVRRSCSATRCRFATSVEARGA
jgi:hypothetical protein